jgi:hypothetical protein
MARAQRRPAAAPGARLGAPSGKSARELPGAGAALRRPSAALLSAPFLSRSAEADAVDVAALGVGRGRGRGSPSVGIGRGRGRGRPSSRTRGEGLLSAASAMPALVRAPAAWHVGEWTAENAEENYEKIKDYVEIVMVDAEGGSRGRVLLSVVNKAPLEHHGAVLEGSFVAAEENGVASWFLSEHGSSTFGVHLCRGARQHCKCFVFSNLHADHWRARFTEDIYEDFYVGSHAAASSLAAPLLGDTLVAADSSKPIEYALPPPLTRGAPSGSGPDVTFGSSSARNEPDVDQSAEGTKGGTGLARRLYALRSASLSDGPAGSTGSGLAEAPSKGAVVSDNTGSHHGPGGVVTPLAIEDGRWGKAGEESAMAPRSSASFGDEAPFVRGSLEHLKNRLEELKADQRRSPCDIIAARALQKSRVDGKKDHHKHARDTAGDRGRSSGKRGSRRGKDRKRRRRSSSSRSSSSSTCAAQPSFRLASSRSGSSENLIRQTAETHPGSLLEAGVCNMRRLLSERRGAGGGEAELRLDALITAYLTRVLQATRSDPLPKRSERELRTLAEALDSLLSGDLAHAGDILMQRFKAIETAEREGNWNVASRLELIPEATASAVSHAEREAAMSLELRERKYLSLVKQR